MRIYRITLESDCDDYRVTSEITGDNFRDAMGRFIKAHPTLRDHKLTDCVDMVAESSDVI